MRMLRSSHRLRRGEGPEAVAGGAGWEGVTRDTAHCNSQPSLSHFSPAGREMSRSATGQQQQ